jgi:hypothetical protein
MGHLVGVGRPHMAPPDVAPPVPPQQSMGVAMKHTPKLSPPLISSRCMIKGPKEATHGQLDPPCLCRCSNGQRGFIPTLYYTSRGPTPKGKCPLINGQSADAVHRRLTVNFHQTDSFLFTCKKTPNGAMWCVGLRRFIGGLIQGQGGHVTWIDDMAIE